MIKAVKSVDDAIEKLAQTIGLTRKVREKLARFAATLDEDIARLKGQSG